MNQFTGNQQLNKLYFASAVDGMSFALAYYEREDNSRFLALIKDYGSTAVDCSKYGPFVFEIPVQFSCEALGSIQRMLTRMTTEYCKDKPVFDMDWYFSLMITFIIITLFIW